MCICPPPLSLLFLSSSSSFSLSSSSLSTSILSSSWLCRSPWCVSLPLSFGSHTLAYLPTTPYLIHCASQRKSAPFTGLFTLATIHTTLCSPAEYILYRVGKLDGIREAVVTILGPGRGRPHTVGSSKIKASVAYTHTPQITFAKTNIHSSPK